VPDIFTFLRDDMAWFVTAVMPLNRPSHHRVSLYMFSDVRYIQYSGPCRVTQQFIENINRHCRRSIHGPHDC